jgi:hypothetical protein
VEFIGELNGELEFIGELNGELSRVGGSNPGIKAISDLISGSRPDAKPVDLLQVGAVKAITLLELELRLASPGLLREQLVVLSLIAVMLFLVLACPSTSFI